MREIMLDHITNLTASIVSLSLTADDLAEGATRSRGQPLAEILDAHARDCRIRVLKAQGELVGAVEAFMISFKEAS